MANPRGAQERLQGRLQVLHCKLAFTPTRIKLTFQSVTKVDKSAKTVTTSSGETIKYDNLVLAPGGKPKKIPIDGADLEGVMTLRTVEDTKKIVSSVTKDSEIVIIGTSFIGMEVSMALIKKEPKSVTLVGMDEIPFAAILGEDIGKAIMEVSPCLLHR
jgi:NAD(P)H-nitrite reductase large subunit